MENVASGSENFALQWRDLVGSIDSSRNALQARLEELEQHFESEKSLIQSRQQKIQDREKEMEAKVSNLKLEMESVIKELHKVESLIEEKGKEVGVKERRLVEVEKLVEENERDCNFISKCIEERSEKLNKCNEEIELKVAQLNAIRGSIEQVKQEQGKVKDFAVLKKSMEEWSSKLGVKERELEGWVEKLEFREKQVESMLEELSVIDKRASECLNEVQSKEQHFDSLGKLIQEQKCHLDSQESSFQERSHGLAMKERNLEQHAEELELKQQEFLSAINSMKEQIENLKSKGITFPHSEVETDQHVLSTPANIVNVTNAATSSSPNLQLNSIKNKSNLQCPPTELLSENHTMQNKMLLALQLSSDPEKLVLKLMQISFANCWRNGDVVFNSDFMKKNISMLKDLRKVLPHAGTHVRDDAIRLAVQWKAKMRAETENSLEILCFLHFTATYGCLSTLSEDEIFKFLEMICQHKEARELCQTLGLADKIAALVQTLTEKKRLIMAVGFICSFNLIEKFPPVLLLKRCVEDARKCNSTIWQKNKSLDEKDEIVDNLIANLRDVIQCIKDNKLEYEFASKDVETEIVGLQKLKENWRCSVPSVASEVEQEEKVKGKRLVRNKAFNIPPELRRSKRLKPPSELL